jgi:hypothetical protein
VYHPRDNSLNTWHDFYFPWTRLGMRFFALVQMGMDLAQRSLYIAELVVGRRREIQIDMDKVNFQKTELMR